MMSQIELEVFEYSLDSRSRRSRAIAHRCGVRAVIDYSRDQEQCLRETADTFGVPTQDLPKTAERFFSEWKEQRKRIEQLEAEIVRLRTSGGGQDTKEIDGVRVVIMEVDGDLKQNDKDAQGTHTR